MHKKRKIFKKYSKISCNLLDKVVKCKRNKTAKAEKEKVMKKILTLIISAILCVGCTLGLTACGDDKPTLQVYTNAGFAPYEYVNENGEVVGIDIDIMQEIGEVLGYNVVINDIEFGLIMEEVGKDVLAVGAAGMTKTDERDEAALASSIYATSVQYVIAPKGSLDEVLNTDGKVELSALAGKKIGVQQATTGDFMVSDAISGTEDEDGNPVKGALEDTDATVTQYSNAIIASDDIGSALDVVVIDKLPAQSIAGADAENLQAYELAEEPESYVLYFNKGATELVAKVNAVLDTMIANGVINFYTLKHSGGIVG